MIVKTDDTHYKNIVKALYGTDVGASRLPNEYPDGLLPSEMPQMISDIAQESYDTGYGLGKSDGEESGYKNGKEDGIIEGIVQGKQAEYDAFWNAYQNNGNRTDYGRCFSGLGWTAETFRPKYDIKPRWGGAAAIFQRCGFVGNLKEHLANLGVNLDFSGLITLSQPFYQASYITELPDIDISGCTSGECQYLFYNCTALTTVKIIIGETVIIASNSFTGCTALETLIIEGTIGGNGFNVQWSTKLSYESLRSIINCLQDKSTDTSKTWTVTVGSENLAKLTEEDLIEINSKGWEFI